MKMSKTILIIEDDKSLREAMVDVLHLKNFATIEAKNGQEGVDLALSKHPDLIILDLIMPKMDGMDAFKSIREDKWGEDIPVIIFTNLNLTNEKMIEDMVKHKPLYYLIKFDWKIYDLVKKVEEILN